MRAKACHLLQYFFLSLSVPRLGLNLGSESLNTISRLMTFVRRKKIAMFDVFWYVNSVVKT
jgi:hypothetical protein